jgi:hypothetical protein
MKGSGGRLIRTLQMAAKNLLARPSRTTLTMLGIIIGVTVIIAISIANAGAIESLTAVFGVVAGNSDLVVLSSTDDEEGFPEEALRRVTRFPGVKAAARRHRSRPWRRSWDRTRPRRAST